MANNEEAEETAVHGNEWEVVSLTASAYAAASGPKQVEVSDDDKGKLIGTSEAETSRAMFMSGHFVFPPSQHENLPLEPENTKAHTDQSVEDAVSEMVVEEGGVSDSKDKENWNIKGLNVADEVPGIQFFYHKGNMLSISGAEFEEGATLPGLNLVDEEQSFYSATKFSSFHSDATIGGSTIAEDNTVIAEPIESSEQSLDSDIPYLPNSVDEDQYTGSKLPCEAWWKRRAASLYAHAKEANAFWSIFIAAAVMGLVILGQQWQQERWQVLQLKWQLSLNDERMGRMLGPISRLKDAVVGGQRRGSCILGSTASER